MALEVNGAIVRFSGVTALDGIDVNVPPGRVTALIGPNGSGKTTLLNAISGFVHLAAGQILLDGVPLHGMSVHNRVARGISRTFQTPRIDPDITVEVAVLSGFFSFLRPNFAATLLSTRDERRAERQVCLSADQLLTKLGLDGHRNAPLSDLPMGAVRLVDVARAMASNPRCLLLDEPAAGLSPIELRVLAERVKEVAGSGVGVLLVEHNFALIRQLADYVFVLSRGSLLVQGSAEEVARDRDFLRVYFGSERERHQREDISANA